MDQYLYPFFKKDLQEGRLSLDQAAEWLGDFLLYAARLEWIVEMSWRDYMQKGVLSSVGLAGTDQKGEEVSNELTYLFLHVSGLSGYAEPHIVIRHNKDTPRWLMRKAIETNMKVKGGVPQFQNSDHAVDYMMKRGVSPDNAYGWITHGCSQGEPADQRSSMATDYLNVPLCVDLVLHDGIASKTGKQIGLKTGDPRNLKTFEEFYNAFKKQVKYVFSRQMWYDRLVDEVKPKYYQQPLVSALMPGCLEKGKDFADGGLSHYRITLRKDRGIIPTADCLTAVKKLIYGEDNKLTMEGLVKALDSNFEGTSGERIRQMCLSAPKYGNDIDEPDLMVRDLAQFTGSVIQSQKNIWGYPYAINRNGQSWHFFAGKRLAALPNGRKSGEPLPDGSLSPMQGLDSGGMTSFLCSVLKTEFKNDSMFGVLNVKLPASLLQAGASREKVIDIVESFFRGGGTYIQFNIMDAKTLKEAKVRPEKHRDLVVRVGGYSAYFVSLSPEVQDEIIQRTEHTV
jgi:formate C-acetyltransferase